MTIFTLLWATVWARKHMSIRRRRAYATDRTLADTNRRYRLLSTPLFFMQTALGIAPLWSQSDWLLPIHNSETFRWLGILLITLGTLLYFSALKFLGDNYSPCFDSHLPRTHVTGGPYRLIRHPMYLGKVIVGAGFVLLSGTGWFVPALLWLIAEMIRSIKNEERTLGKELPGYLEYKLRTSAIVPTLAINRP